MEEKDKRILELALDKVLTRFSNQEFITQDFSNYSKIIRNRFFQDQILHKQKRACGVIGCKEKTIKKSHSIPKTSILKNIAVNGHVLKPEFDHYGGAPKNKMVEIGINNASVFPGYCKKHENLFASFEKDGKFDTATKALLQTLRTICRERVYREVELKINTLAKSEYKKKIKEEATQYLASLLSDHPKFQGIEDIEIEGVDKVINTLNYLNNHLSQPVEQFELFESNIYNWLLKLPLKNNLIVRVVNIDFHIPISACGFGNQVYIENDVKKDAYVLLNIMPKQSSTDIICVGLEKDKSLIIDFLNFSFSNPLNLLNMIESFIINGTDHWFINPTYWNSFSDSKREKILYDILFSEDSFIDQYPFSIFDDIRQEIIKILTDNINSRDAPMTSFEKEKIEFEMNKLSNTDYQIIRDVDVLVEKLYKMLLSHNEKTAGNSGSRAMAGFQ